MRHLGIFQYSVEGALLCFGEVMREAQQRLGDHQHPVVTMSGLAMADALGGLDARDFPALNAQNSAVVDRLARTGADFFVCPDNTIHIAFEHESARFTLPCLHIAEVVADEAQARGFAKVGILGTEWTMTGPVYPGALGARGIDWAIPPDDVRAELHRIIMEELCPHRPTAASVDYYREAVRGLAADGCDSVALVCTEIPLILNDSNSALPTLSSTHLLARAAVDVALGERPLPTWRGGPVQG